MSKTFDGAVSASPSLTIPGGTVYTFADGTSVVVSGGNSAAYRGNSPGFNLGSVNSSQLSDPAFQATITAAIQQYGAIGYTVSTGGQVELVFSNATTAAQGMQQKMSGLSAAQSGTAEDVYVAYNGGGNPNAGSLLEDVAESRGQSDLLDIPYAQLTAPQKSAFVSLAMQAEGFNNSSGSSVAPTTQQADPTNFAVAGWMLGSPIGGLNYPVDVTLMPGDTFSVSPDGNTLTINTANGPIVYTTDPDSGKGTVNFGGTSVPIDGVNLQSIGDTATGVQLKYPSSSSTINLNGTTTGSLVPIDMTFPTGDIAWSPASGGNWSGVDSDGTQYFITKGFDDKDNPTTVLTTVSTDALGNSTASFWLNFQAGASPDKTVTLAGITGPVTLTGSGVSVGGDQPFSYSFLTNAVSSTGAVTATTTIGGETVTLIGLGGTSPFALISNDNSITAGAVSSISVSDTNGNQYLRVGTSDVGVLVNAGQVAGTVQFAGGNVVSTASGSGVINVLTPDQNGNLQISQVLDPSKGAISTSFNEDGSVTYIQTVSTTTTDVTVGVPGESAPAIVVTESVQLPDPNGGSNPINVSLQTSYANNGVSQQSLISVADGEVITSAGINLAAQLYTLGGGKSALVGVIAQASTNALTSMAQSSTPLDFGTAFEQALPAAAIAYGINTLLQEAGLSGPGEQFISQFASSLSSQAIAAASSPTAGETAFQSVQDVFGKANLEATAGFAAFSVAEQSLISAWASNATNSADIEVGSDVGGAVGTVVGWLVGENPLSAFIGNAVGQFIGALIGSIFGPSHPTVGPDADAWITWSGGTNVSVGTVGLDNGGNSEQSVEMASQAALEVQSLLKAIGGTVESVQQIKFGYFKNGFFDSTDETNSGTDPQYQPGSPYFTNLPSNPQASDILQAMTATERQGVYRVIEGSSVYGGSLYVEKVIAEDAAGKVDLVQLSSDVNTAIAYQNYLNAPAGTTSDTLQGNTIGQGVVSTVLSNAAALGLTSALTESLSASNTQTIWNGGNVVGLISGNNDTVTAIGGSDVLTVSGNGDTVALTYLDQVNILASNAVETISGPVQLVIAGNGDTVAISDSADTVGITGNGDTLALSNGISLGLNASNVSTTLQSSASQLSVSGSNDSVAIVGGNDTLTLSGAGDTAQMSSGTLVAAQGAYISASATPSQGANLIGDLDTLSLMGGAVSIGSGDILTITGGGNTISANTDAGVTLAGTSDNLIATGATDLYLVVTGNNESATGFLSGSVVLDGTSDSVVAASVSLAANGQNSTVNLARSTVTLASSVSLQALGSADLFTGGTSDTLTLQGSGHTIAFASGTVLLADSGQNVTLTGSDDFLTGTNDTITLGSIVVHTTIQGSGLTIGGANAGTIDIGGSNNNVSASNASIRQQGSGDSLTVSGSGDTIVAADNAIVTVAGNDDTVNWVKGGEIFLDGTDDFVVVPGGNFTGGSLWLGASNNVGTLSNGYIGVQGTLSVELTGVDDFISGGRGDTLSIAGTGNTVVLSQASIVMLRSGASLEIAGDHDTAQGAVLSELTLSGNSDFFVGQASSLVLSGNEGTFEDTGNPQGMAVLVTGDDDLVEGVTGGLMTFDGTSDSLDGFSINLTVNGDDAFIAMSGGTVTLAAGVQAQLTGYNDVVNGGFRDVLTVAAGSTGDTVNLWAATVILQSDGDSLTMTGGSNLVEAVASTGDTLILDGGDTTASLNDSTVGFKNGTTVQVSAIGYDEVINGNIVSGTGDTLQLDGGTVAFEDVSAQALAGNNDLVTGTDGDVLSVSGTGDTIGFSNGTVVLAVGASVSVTGSSDLVVGNQATLGLVDGAQLQLSGSDDVITGSGGTVTLEGAGDYVIVTGNNDAINIDEASGASGDTILLTGSNDTANLSDGVVGFAEGSDVQVTATGFVDFQQNLTGNGINDTLLLQNGTVTLSAGGRVSVIGTNDHIEGQGGTATLDDADPFIGLVGGTISDTAAGATISISGVSDVFIGAQGDAVNVTGGTDTLDLSNGWVGLSNLSVTINGDGDLVSGYGDTLSLSGTAEVVSMQNGTVLLGGNESITVTGVSDILAGTGTGDIIAFGTDVFGETVELNGASIAAAASASMTVIGNDDTITASHEVLYLTGTADTVAATPGLTLTDIYLGDYSQVTVTGTKDVLVGGSHDEVTITSVVGTLVADYSSLTSLTGGATDTLSGIADTFDGAIGDTIFVGGTNDTVVMSGGSVHAGLITGVLTVIGDSDSLALDNGTIFLEGVADHLTGGSGNTVLGGPGDSVILDTGGSDTLALSNSTIMFANTIATQSLETVTGDGDLIIDNAPASSTIVLAGSGDSLTAASPVQVSVLGFGAGISANQSYVSLGAGNLQVSLTGTSDQLSSNFTGDVITLNGQYIAFSGTQDSIVLGAGASATVWGSNNIVGGGSSAYLSVAGSNETVMLSNGTIDIGAATVLDGSADIVTIETTSVITENGAGNVLSAYPSADLSLTVSGNTVDFQSGTVNLLANMQATLIGDYDTVTGGTGDTLMLTGEVHDQADTVTFTSGTVLLGNTVNLAVTGAGDTVILGSQDEVALTGSGDVVIGSSGDIVVNGQSDMLQVSSTSVEIGTGNRTTVAGNGDQIAGLSDVLTLSGFNNVVIINSGTVSVQGAGSSVTIGGSSDTITAGASISTIVTGIADTVAGAAGDTITLQNNGDTVTTATGSTVTLAGTADVLNGGTSDLLIMSGVSNTASLTNGTIEFAGGGAAITVTAGSATDVSLTVNGSGNALSLTGGNAVLANGLQERIIGADNSISHGSGDTLTLTDTGNTVTLFYSTVNIASGTSVTIGGSGDIVYANNAIVTLSGDTAALLSATAGSAGGQQIVGTGDTLIASNYAVTLGNGVTTTLNGNQDQIMGGSGDVLNVSGTGDTIGLSNATINVAAGSVVTVTGSNDVINAPPTASVTITGANDQLPGNTNQTVSLTSSANVQLYSSSITLASGLSVSVTGNGNTISGGTGDALFLSGSADTVTLSAGGIYLNTATALPLTGNQNNIAGTGDTLTLMGTGNTLSMTRSTITLGANATVTLNGETNILEGTGTGDVVLFGADYVANTIELNGVSLSVISPGTMAVIGNNDTISSQSGSFFVSGTSDVLTVSKAKTATVSLGSNTGLNLTANAASLIGGSYDTVTLTAASGVLVANYSSLTSLSGDASATLHGNADTFYAAQDGDYLLLSGTNDSVVMSNGQLVATSGVGGLLSVTGNGDALTVSGVSEALITGTRDTLTLSQSSVVLGAGSTITIVNSDGDVFDGAGADSLILGGGTLDTVAFSGGTVSIVGFAATGVATITGNSDAIGYSAQNGATVVLDGNSDVLTTAAHIAAVAGGAADSLSLNGATVTLSGAQQAILSGYSDTLNGTGSVTVIGTPDTDDLSGGTVTLTASESLAVNGTNHTIAGGAGDTITLTGANDTLALSAGTVKLQGFFQATLTGSQDSVTLAADTLTLIGSANSLQGGGNQIMIANGASDSISGANNTIFFGAGVADDQLWFAQSGNNLQVSVIGTGETETLVNWYGTGQSSAVFKTGDGHTLQTAQVANLVNAMAQFSPPPIGQTTLTASESASLESVIAANWT